MIIPHLVIASCLPFDSTICTFLYLWYLQQETEGCFTNYLL